MKHKTGTSKKRASKPQPTKLLENRSGETPLHLFLSEQLKLSGKQARRLLDERRVFVNGKRIWMARHLLKNGDAVEILPLPPPPRPSQPIPILHEDGSCLVVNKPTGILTNGPDSLEALLQRQHKNPELRAVHRLDRDTTGCLLVAKNDEARSFLIKEFKARRVEKHYTALVLGTPSPPVGFINAPIDGQPAGTHYTLLASGKTASCLSLDIKTGRKHQIRKHLAELGHPILGDKDHLLRKILDTDLRTIPRQQLHAARVAFISPATGQTVRAIAPEPPDFKKLRIQLTAKKRPRKKFPNRRPARRTSRDAS